MQGQRLGLEHALSTNTARKLRPEFTPFTSLPEPESVMRVTVANAIPRWPFLCALPALRRVVY